MEKLAKSVEMLGMLYSFDNLEIYEPIQPPDGYRVAGYNDVNVLLCKSIETGDLYMLQPESNALLLMAQGVDEFIDIAKKYNAISTQLSDQDYLSEVKSILNKSDPRLVKDYFWGSIVEEIENGVI